MDRAEPSNGRTLAPGVTLYPRDLDGADLQPLPPLWSRIDKLALSLVSVGVGGPILYFEFFMPDEWDSAARGVTAAYFSIWALVLAAIAVRWMLPFLHPPLEFESSAERLEPGDALRVGWGFARPPRRIGRLEIALEARRYGVEGGSWRDVRLSGAHEGYDVLESYPLATLADPADIRSGALGFRIPTDVRRSRRSERSWVAWMVTVRGRTRVLPDMTAEFELEIRRREPRRGALPEGRARKVLRDA